MNFFYLNGENDALDINIKKLIYKVLYKLICLVYK